jgi:hypothetical protein
LSQRGSIALIFDDALDFVLPRFSRHAWTSDVARDQWEPRMEAIRAALQDLTLESVSRGMRDCGLIQVRDDELDTLVSRCADGGLAVLPLEHAASPKSIASVTATNALQSLVGGPLPSGMATAVVGRSAEVETVAAAWERGACADVATLLGYPLCCGRFLAELVDERRLDATWSMAHNSDQAPNDLSHFSIGVEPETNLLWAPLGITPVPHVPCSFGCAASRQVGQQITDLARATGHEAEIRWMHQILSWPVSWSALHGIAETKTPILKMVTRTDATAAKHALDFHGAEVPDSATPGLSFPHRPPRRLKISDSRSFQRGLANTDSKQPLS